MVDMVQAMRERRVDIFGGNPNYETIEYRYEDDEDAHLVYTATIENKHPFFVMLRTVLSLSPDVLRFRVVLRAQGSHIRVDIESVRPLYKCLVHIVLENIEAGGSPAIREIRIESLETTIALARPMRKLVKSHIRSSIRHDFELFIKRDLECSDRQVE